MAWVGPYTDMGISNAYAHVSLTHKVDKAHSNYGQPRNKVGRLLTICRPLLAKSACDKSRKIANHGRRPLLAKFAVESEKSACGFVPLLGARHRCSPF